MVEKLAVAANFPITAMTVAMTGRSDGWTHMDQASTSVKRYEVKLTKAGNTVNRPHHLLFLEENTFFFAFGGLMLPRI